MTFFGQPTDILDSLANELDASASQFDGEAGRALRVLAERLFALSPLYVALCDYCNDQTADDFDLRTELKKLNTSDSE